MHRPAIAKAKQGYGLKIFFPQFSHFEKRLNFGEVFLLYFSFPLHRAIFFVLYVLRTLRDWRRSSPTMPLDMSEMMNEKERKTRACV